MNRIELRRIEVHVGLSEETPAYTAKLFVDGEHFADVSNGGHGGCDMLRFVDGQSHETFKALDERVAAEYPPHDCHGMTLEESVEMMCHGLVWEHVDQRKLRAKLGRKVLVTRDGDVYELKGRKSDALVAAASRKYGRTNVLNAIPFDRAWEIFKAA